MKVTNTNFFQAIELLLNEVKEIKDSLNYSNPEGMPIPPHKQLSHIPIDIDEVSKLTLKSKSSIYRLSSKGEIPCYKHGKKLYFFRDEIIDYIRDGKKRSIADILAEAETFNIKRARA